MNKRLKKKIDKRKRDKIHKILDMVLDINGFEERKVEKTGSKPTVFASFSGHISEIKVSVYSGGWSGFGGPDFRKSCYLDGRRGETAEKLLSALKKKAAELKEE